MHFIIPEANKSQSDFLKFREDKSMFLSPITELVSGIFKSLQRKQSNGHDGIISQLIKDVAKMIAYGVSTQVNHSIQLGYAPLLLKIAKILPLHKTKERNLMTNYRPISLLPNSLTYISNN